MKSGLIVEELLKSYKIFILTVLAKRKIFQEKMFNKKYDIIGDFEFLRKSFKYNYGALQGTSCVLYRHHSDNYSKRKIQLYYEELINWMKNFKAKNARYNYNLSFVKKLLKTRIKIYINKLLQLGV